MNPAIIISILAPIIEAAKPEFLAAIKTLRERGALTDDEIASTEAKAKTTLEQLELEAQLPRR
jgi:transcription initiation factor IIE alpha subunit